MRIEIGNELETVKHRLSDIIFLAEKTVPVDKDDWKGYAESLCKLIATQAREAQTALLVHNG